MSKRIKYGLPSSRFLTLIIAGTSLVLSSCGVFTPEYKSIFYATTECKFSDTIEFGLQLSVIEIKGERSASLTLENYAEDTEDEWSAPDAVIRHNYVSIADRDGSGYILMRAATGKEYRRSDGFVIHLVKNKGDKSSGVYGLCDDWLFEHEGRS